MSAHVGAATVYLNQAIGTWTVATPDAYVSGIGTNEITWGHPLNNPKSGYKYTTGAPASAALGSDFVVGTFTHNNFPIYNGTQITSAKLRLDYDISVDNGSSIGSFLGTSWFEFDHWETLNAANPCADGGANYSGVNGYGCADRVTFSLNQALSDSFSYNGLTYQLTLTGFLLGDNSLADEFWTSEGKSNSARLVGRVTAVPLPAAGPLFASILAVFGFLRMRNRKRAALVRA